MHLYWINIDVMFPITSSTVVFGTLLSRLEIIGPEKAWI